MNEKKRGYEQVAKVASELNRNCKWGIEQA